MTRLARELTVDTKSLGDGGAVFRYRASDATIDSYGELIDPAGWLFDERWDSNPIIVDSHQYDSAPRVIGRGIRREITENALEIDVEFAVDVEGNDLARFVCGMVRDGFFPACSVGFAPVDFASPYGDLQRWQRAVSYASAKFGLTPAQIARLQGIHMKQQLWELSPCVLPANPKALVQRMAQSLSDGTLTQDSLARLTRHLHRETSRPISPVVQPRTESDPAPTEPTDGATVLARSDANAALLWKVQRAAGLPTRREVLNALEKVCA